MVVPRVAVGGLEAKTALTEIHLPGDASLHHPLERPVQGGTADALIVTPDEFEQVVGAEVSLLAEEHVQDLLPLAGPLPTSRLQIMNVRKGRQD
jgi:hypothetical protein